MMSQQPRGMQAVTAALAARNSAPPVINGAMKTIASQPPVMTPGAPTSPRGAAASGKTAVTAALQSLVSETPISSELSVTISWRDLSTINVAAEEATIAVLATRAKKLADSTFAFG